MRSGNLTVLQPPPVILVHSRTGESLPETAVEVSVY